MVHLRRLEDTESSQTKKRRKVSSDPALPCNKETDKLNEGVVELISISDDEGHSPVATVLGRKSVTRCDEARTLILVEDVDILFPEDRGCIAAIQQIAETAKGPIILTSNSKMTCYYDESLLTYSFYQIGHFCEKIFF